MSTNVEASVRARLRNKMQDTGLEFQYLLTRYACERFLYRLGASSLRDRCILKGASLLAVWMDEPYRATRDIDVLALDGSDESYAPPDAFDVISERIFSFLAPVRESVLADSPFDTNWPPGGPWSAADARKEFP